MSSERFLTFTICDDFRLEIGNKFSLIGCYAGTPIFINPIPSVIPKLCVIAAAHTPVERPFTKLVVRVMRGDKPIAELPFSPQMMPQPVALQEGARRITILAALIMSPFPVEAAGALRVEAETEDDTLVGGQFWIEQAPVVVSPPSAP